MKKSRKNHLAPRSLPRREGGPRRGSKRYLLLSLTLAAGLVALAAAAGFRPAGLTAAEAARQQGNDPQAAAPVNTQGNRASDPVSVESLAGGDAAAPSAVGPRAGERVNVLVELTDAPTTHVYAEAIEKSGLPKDQAEALANEAAQTQLAVIEAAQQRLGSTLKSTFRATEIYRVQRVLNGIAVKVDGGQLGALRRTPGVKAVHILIPETVENSTSVPFLGVPQLWDNSLGIFPNLTGTGMKVGVIDTGIDYIHANFGGTGAMSAYQANDRTTNADGFFPTAKVVGGRDFAGDRYNASAGTTADPTDTDVPTPDEDPMDCNSHGTHVSGTAAGLGVNADGTTFAGPYGVATPFNALRIGPGTAPGASLFALRVFGCVGSTLLTPQAIEFSVDPNADGNFSDRLDVINMSLGSGYGSGFNPSEVASTNAALAGVFVVASAGNSNDSFFITGAPGSSPRALSVASSVDSGASGAGGPLRVNAPASIAGDKPAATVAYGPRPNGETGDVVLANDGSTSINPDPSPSPTPIPPGTPPGTTSDACQQLVNPAQVAGKIVIADRGLCTIKTKTLNAQRAGAIGLIVNNNNTTDIAPPGFADDGNISTPITIPTLSILKPDGDGIKAELASNTVNVTFGAGTPADTLSSFSSRGPRRAEFPLRLKPDISAPGQAITSSLTGIVQSGGTAGNVAIQPGSQTLTISGTSMAAPHMAGIMALLRQLHPDWSVEELKASAMNGAINDVFTTFTRTQRFGLSRIGAGRTNPPNSATNTAVAYDANNPGVVSVSSFENEVVGSATRTQTIRVVNKGTTALTYTLGIDTLNDSPGVAFSLPGGTSLSVPAGQTVTFDVQMSATADQMDHLRDPTLPAVQGANARQYMSEEGAYVTFSQGSALKMRVPVYATPRPASNMRATDVIVTGGATSGQTALALNGTDVCTGTRSPADCAGNTPSFPTDVVSLVTPFELQVNDPADPGQLPAGDLRYAGVSFDGASLVFGVATYGDWTWPRDTEFDIYIDANEDGLFERILFNTSTSVGGFATDVYVTALVNNPSTGGAVLQSFVNGVSGATRDTAIYNNNVMFLPVPAASLGLNTGGTPDTSFRWAIRVFDDEGNVDEVGFGTFGTPSGPRTFNLAAPGLSFPPNFSSPNNSGILFADLDTRTIPVNFNRTNLTNNGSLGALLLHHHNARGTRAEVVTVQGTTQTTADLAVGKAVSSPNPALNSNVTFTIQASNLGPTNATNVSVLDQLPAGLTFVSATPSVGTYSPVTGVWTIGSLASGASATLQIVATVTTTNPVTNTARIAGADQLDTNGSNDSASVTVSAPRSADLSVSITPNVSATDAGSSVTYTVTVTNAGEDTANNIVVTTTFAPGVTVTGSSLTTGAFNPATGVWQIASLGKGNSATLTITVTAPVVCGNLVATSTVTAETADPNTINNTASSTIPVQPSTSVQFSQATFTVNEDSTAVNVVVNRTGDTTIPLSVQYATSDGTATQRSDYGIALGRLEFAAGETSKTIPVLINEDSLVEGAETFTITLSNTNSCDVGIGSQQTATVQINDDSSEPSTNAIDDTTLFVRQQYHDFLNREPDAAGLAFWVNNIESCGTNAACRAEKRTDTSAAFFLSIEFQQTGYLVYRTFAAAFGPTRVGSTVPLTYQEFQTDVQRVGRGFVVGQAGADALLEANKQAYFNEFVTRSEFVTKYPASLTNEQYVDNLLASANLSPSQVRLFVVNMTNGQEVPPAVPTATGGGSRPTSSGTARLRFNEAQTAMTFTSTVNNIDFTGQQTPGEANDNLTVGHIHAGPNVTPTTNGPVVWGFFGSPFNDNNPNDNVVRPFSGGDVGGSITGKWDAPEGNNTTLAAQLANLREGRAYVNFHTTQFPGGEIRGNVPAANAFRNTLVAGLNAGTETRATVLRKVAEAEELRDREFNRAFVLAQYFGYLRRNPNDSPDANFDGYNFWLNKLNQFGGDFRRAEMVRAFIISGEYRRRFGLN